MNILLVGSFWNDMSFGMTAGNLGRGCRIRHPSTNAGDMNID
jgi:hypothetical protein